MKVLFVDCAWDGHHQKYYKALYDSIDCDKLCVIPEEDTYFKNCRVVKFNTGMQGYYSFFNSVRDIAKDYKPDSILFLYADITYKYFGVSLGFFRNYNSIFVFHCMRESAIKNLSRKLIARNASHIVVHLPIFEKQLQQIGIKNTKCIQYPSFWDKEKVVALQDNKSARGDHINLLLIGAMREEKGYKQLIMAANSLEPRFHITIAGNATNIRNDNWFIKAKGMKNISIVDKYLSEEEYMELLSKTDYIILPYTWKFSGASGPLTDAAAMGLPAIVSDLPTIGNIVKTYHLGLTFVPEDVQDLIKTINSIKSPLYEYDNVAQEYQKSISLNCFIKDYHALLR